MNNFHMNRPIQLSFTSGQRFLHFLITNVPHPPTSNGKNKWFRRTVVISRPRALAFLEIAHKQLMFQDSSRNVPRMTYQKPPKIPWSYFRNPIWRPKWSLLSNFIISMQQTCCTFSSNKVSNSHPKRGHRRSLCKWWRTCTYSLILGKIYDVMHEY